MNCFGGIGDSRVATVHQITQTPTHTAAKNSHFLDFDTDCYTNHHSIVINMAKYVILTLILKPNKASNPTVPKHLKSFDGVACQLNWSSFVQIGWFCQ